MRTKIEVLLSKLKTFTQTSIHERQLSVSLDYYHDLEGEIAQLKAFAEPLMEEVKVTPLMPVINRIINLKDRLLGLSEGELQYVQAEVAECKRLLDDISYEYIKQIITKPIPSDVFGVLSSGTEFEKTLRSAIGKKISTGKGDPEVAITPDLVDALTRYRFSLGTPPVTPKGIQTLRKLFLVELCKIFMPFEISSVAIEGFLIVSGCRR